MSNHAVIITSFGYGHGAPPEHQHLTIDLREHFRDPHVTPGLRELTAHHPDVQHTVLGTPGIADLAVSVTAAVRAFLAGPGTGQVRVAFGCVGGRHRSAVIAAHVTHLLRAGSLEVALTHRDLHRPVITR